VRYQLCRAIEIACSAGRLRLRGGTVISATLVEAQAGDVVMGGPLPNTRVVPLDTECVAALASLGISAVVGQNLGGAPTGADSVDG
jgi:hypothetical protein